LGLAETRLAVTMNGRPAGFATLSQKVMPDGVKLVEMRVELGSGQGKVNLHIEARYDAKGMPVRKFQEVSVGGKLQKQIVASFNPKGANVVINEGGKRTVKDVTIVAAAPRANLSEFWFVRDDPKAGASEEAYQFNLDSLQWEIVKTEYKGKKTIRLEDRSVEVHEIVTSRGQRKATSYVDDDGLPVLVDQGDMKMVKLWPK
jgi:hypothetical protein